MKNKILTINETFNTTWHSIAGIPEKVLQKLIIPGHNEWVIYTMTRHSGSNKASHKTKIQGDRWSGIVKTQHVQAATLYGKWNVKPLGSYHLGFSTLIDLIQCSYILKDCGLGCGSKTSWGWFNSM